MLPVAMAKMAAMLIDKRGFARMPPLRNIGKSAKAEADSGIVAIPTPNSPEPIPPITEIATSTLRITAETV
jgi:hypothetical protein